jgi:4-hydroxy-3-polyprenylbenzoate decarboxylase
VIWSFLRQFMYTKFVIVVDEDVNARDWKDVIWAMTTRMDPARDTVHDHRQHADRLSGFCLAGVRAGFQDRLRCHQQMARRNRTREWGRPLAMSEAVKQRVDRLWPQLGL